MKRTTKTKAIGFNDLNDKLDLVIDQMATKEDVNLLESKIENLEKKFDLRFQQVLSAIDGLVKVVTDMQREYAAVAAQLSRHEQWIKLIAEKTGVKLTI